jgi:hypothetical protein
MWSSDKSLPVMARGCVVALSMALGLLGCVNLSRPQVGLLDGPPPDTVTHPDADGGAGDVPEGDTDPASDTTPDPDADGDAVPPGPDADIDGPDQPVDTGPEAMPLVNGRPCSAAGQCESGQCVDGVCCESACGDCRACNATGSEGRCTMVAAGEDPGNDCPQDPVAMCQRDGTCNGAGACRLYTAGTECAAGRCMTTTEFAASTCDGAGMCKAGASRTCPGGGTCMGSSCGSSCTVDANCQTGFFCDQSICRAKRARGAACTGPAQCASNFCADGICCATACTETCHSCNVASAVGTCTPVPAGQDPRNVCPADPAASCARDGTCNGAGACRFYAAGSTCGASTCTGTSETPASTCNGLGTCMATTSRDCGAYACGATACATTCSSGAQCNAGYTCPGTTCQPIGGLVLYWKLDDPSGTIAADSSGNNRAGTYTGSSGSTPTTSPVVPTVRFPDPASRRFDRGSRHAVRLSPMPSALKPATTLTISVWYRSGSLDVGEAIASEEVVSGGDTYLIRVRADGIEFSVSTTSGRLKCQMNVNRQIDNGWHHVVGVTSSTGVKGYFDGVEQCSTAGSINNNINYNLGTDLMVGRHGFGDTVYNFEGNIDEVRIYNRTLSPAEVLRLAQGHSQL